MLAATMIGGPKYANRVDLTRNTAWTSTTSGTIYLTIATSGGAAGGNLPPSGNYGCGGAGGGGYVTGYPLTVSSGSSVLWQNASGSGIVTAAISIDGSDALRIEYGRDGSLSSSDGSPGASISLSSFGTLSGGNGGGSGGSLGVAGSPGQTYRSGTIFAVTGGGGGSGNTASPAATGGAGGAAGPFGSIAAIGIWGAAGNGYLPGANRLTTTTTTVQVDAFAYVEW